LLEAKVWVIQADMDSRLEGFIDGADTVCGEKENARIVI
jgi:hypothetical protein